MFSLIAGSLRTGSLTEGPALDARPAFGFPVIDFSRCTACEACAAACPTGAISVSPPAEDRRTMTVSYAQCVQCRACVAACAEHAVSPGQQPVVVAFTRAQLERGAVFDIESATGRCRFHGPAPLPSPGLEEAGARLRERVRGRFGRSLHVRQVDAGSCNGCEIEIAAATNPFYDLERFGIHLVASPRHADLLLVTGPVTRNMEVALRRTYEATPEPRLVVAVGACGCSGGIFGEGTYASLGGVDRVLPVDVYVPGCPPRPQDILNGLLVAMGVREPRAGVS